MARKIAINGFGRIGRQVFRLLEARNDIDVVAINDLTSPEMLAHLLQYDSVHGKFDAEVKVVDGGLVVNGRTVRTTAQPDPTKLAWDEVEAELEGPPRRDPTVEIEHAARASASA